MNGKSDGEGKGKEEGTRMRRKVFNSSKCNTICERIYEYGIRQRRVLHLYWFLIVLLAYDSASYHQVMRLRYCREKVAWEREESKKYIEFILSCWPRNENWRIGDRVNTWVSHYHIKLRREWKCERQNGGFETWKNLSEGGSKKNWVNEEKRMEISWWFNWRQEVKERVEGVGRRVVVDNKRIWKLKNFGDIYL